MTKDADYRFSTSFGQSYGGHQITDVNMDGRHEISFLSLSYGQYTFINVLSFGNYISDPNTHDGYALISTVDCKFFRDDKAFTIITDPGDYQLSFRARSTDGTIQTFNMWLIVDGNTLHTDMDIEVSLEYIWYTMCFSITENDLIGGGEFQIKASGDGILDTFLFSKINSSQIVITAEGTYFDQGDIDPIEKTESDILKIPIKYPGEPYRLINTTDFNPKLSDIGDDVTYAKMKVGDHIDEDDPEWEMIQWSAGISGQGVPAEPRLDLAGELNTYIGKHLDLVNVVNGIHWIDIPLKLLAEEIVNPKNAAQVIELYQGTNNVISITMTLNVTNPANEDSDYDFIYDPVELYRYSTNPIKSDSDNDEVLDYIEYLEKIGTVASDSDTDEDTFSDNDEISVIFRTGANLDVDGTFDYSVQNVWFTINELVLATNQMGNPLQSYYVPKNDVTISSLLYYELLDTTVVGTPSYIDIIFSALGGNNLKYDPTTTSIFLEIGTNQWVKFDEQTWIGDPDFVKLSHVPSFAVESREMYNNTSNNVDVDKDGMTTLQESEIGTSDTDIDSDDDGISDYMEVYHYGTIPTDADTDDDGIIDGIEVGMINPISPFFDFDSSFSYIKGTEVRDTLDLDPTTTTDPLNPDTDGDGIPDGGIDLNNNLQIDPNEGEDVDGDGMVDEGVGNGPWPNGETDPTAETGIDSDNDGMPDAWEVKWRWQGSFALDPTTDDSEGDEELDDDLLDNYWEYEYGTSPVNANSDKTEIGYSYSAYVESVWINILYGPLAISTDGLMDGYEVIIGSDPTSPWDDYEFDSDGDCIPDIYEDLDQDFSIDSQETDNENPDTDYDGIDDLIEIIYWKYWFLEIENPMSFMRDKYMTESGVGEWSYIIPYGGSPTMSELDALKVAIDYSNLDIDEDDQNDGDIDGYDVDEDGLRDGDELIGWYVSLERNPATESEKAKTTIENPKISSEYWTFSDPKSNNRDGDSLSDIQEFDFGLDPNSDDTDSDGLLDYPQQDNVENIPGGNDFDTVIQEEIPAVLTELKPKERILTDVEVHMHWESWCGVPYPVYDGTTVTVDIEATDNAALSYSYITFKPDDDPDNWETRTNSIGNGIQSGAKVHHQTEVFEISFWKDAVTSYQVTAGCGDLAGNDEVSLTVQRGGLNVILQAAMAFLSNFLPPELVGFIQGMLYGYGKSFLEDLNMFNPFSWKEMALGMIKIPEMIMNMIKDPSMLSSMVQGMVGKTMMMADLLTPYERSDISSDDWGSYLWDGIVELLFPGTRSGTVGGQPVSVVAICDSVFDIIRNDIPDFSSKISDYMVSYFFGDFTGFILAQIFDPMFFITAGASAIIGLVKGLDAATDVTKNLNKASDLTQTTKKMNDAGVNSVRAKKMISQMDELSVAGKQTGDIAVELAKHGKKVSPRQLKTLQKAMAKHGDEAGELAKLSNKHGDELLTVAKNFDAGKMKVNVMDDVIEGTAKGRRVRVKMDHIEELTAVEKAKVGDCAKHLNGAKTEKNMVKYMEKEFASEGMTQVKFGKDFTSPTSHGIDGIFKDKLGNYHFVEAKSHFSDISKNTYGGKNYATKLGKPKMGDQMGNEWLMKYIDRIKDSDISKAEKEIMKLQLAGETAKKHVFIMSGADTAKGFTISQEFADDLGKVGIQQVHILNPA